MIVQPKINIILTGVLAVGLLALFVQSLSINRTVNSNEKRIEALEMRPAPSANVLVPEAGESGKIDMNSLKEYVDSKISESITGKSIASGSPTVSPKATTAPVANTTKKISYLPIFGGNYVTTSTDWADVTGSDFQFNVNEFGSGSYITLDAIIWVMSGSGEVHTRIFDETNGVVVVGSEINGTSGNPILVTSGRLNFFSGNNTYRMQVQSKTSSPVRFDSGRIKIVY